MDRKAIESSFLKSVGYEPDTETLEIEFTAGTCYEFAGVPPEVHAEFLRAESKGQYFAVNIRPKFTCHPKPREGKEDHATVTPKVARSKQAKTSVRTRAAKNRSAHDSAD